MDQDELLDRMDAVATRADLSIFVSSLRSNLLEHPEEWESVTLETYLETLSAVLIDIEGSYLNEGLTVPETPSWEFFAKILLMAASYE